jgi:hypothetical protein
MRKPFTREELHSRKIARERIERRKREPLDRFTSMDVPGELDLVRHLSCSNVVEVDQDDIAAAIRSELGLVDLEDRYNREGSAERDFGEIEARIPRDFTAADYWQAKRQQTLFRLDGRMRQFFGYER